MIGTKNKVIQEVYLEEELNKYYFSYKMTESSFILYEHVRLDDLSEDKKRKKMVKKWRSDVCTSFVNQHNKENTNLLNANSGFRLYLFMLVASKCKTYPEFRNYASVIINIEDFEIMYWYWKMQTSPRKAIHAFKSLFKVEI